MMKRSRATSIYCIALGLLSIATNVQAKRAGFTGLTASANSPDTAFWNPAGITRVPESLELQLATAYSHSEFKVEEATFPGGDPDKEDAINFIPGVYYVKPLNNEWVYGLSVTVPSGFGWDYGNSWSGRYLSEETSLVFLAINNSLAYRWDEDLSFAGGIQMMYVSSESKTRVNNIGPRGDGRLKLDEEGVGAGVTLSSLYELSPETRFGITYRSETEVDLDGNPEFNNIDNIYLAALNDQGLLGQEIDVDFKVPQQLQLGLFHQLNERYSITADVVWIDMSAFGITSVSAGPDHVSVESTFKDAYLTSIGLGYRWDSKTQLNVGIGYMTSPVDDDDRTLYLPLDELWIFGVGVERELQNGDVITVNFEYVDIGDAPVDQENSALSGRVKGKYHDNYAALLDFSYRFNL
jgi:long-chain fatty acid transport protein